MKHYLAKTQHGACPHGCTQLLYASANRLSKHRNICIFSFCKGSLFRASFTIRYAGEFIQELAENQVIIFHVSKALPQHCSQLTFHWPPELPENNYHQHPTYRPRTTRNTAHGSCGEAPDPSLQCMWKP